MVNQLRTLLPVVCLLLANHTLATTRYVDVNSATPTPPYTNWGTASTNIQLAVDAAGQGDLILVTNGIYQTGGRAATGYALTNRVIVTKPLTVQSVNGPDVTSIVGYQVPGTTNGDAAVRCVYLPSGALLAGFTLTNGATRGGVGFLGDHTDQSGGAVYCAVGGGVVSNCLVILNSAYFGGGGVFSGTIKNCTINSNSAGNQGGGILSGTGYNCVVSGNTAPVGAGASFGTLNNSLLTGNMASSQGGGSVGTTLNNCTVTANSAPTGGGASSGTLNNCIVFYNTGFSSANYSGGTRMNYCCATPLASGTGNIAADPQLASASHLSSSSPCRGIGNASYAQGTDIDGEGWLNPPAIGCDEYHAGSVTGPLTVAMSLTSSNVEVGLGVNFGALINGRPSGSFWDFGDGVVVSNRPAVYHVWSTPGDYAVVLRVWNETFPAGVASTATVHVVTQLIHYVALDNGTPVAPFTSWSTAATNIQDAVDVAGAGVVVLVSNGVYQTGGRVIFGAMTNRVAINRAVTVQSVNGSAVTIIKGNQVLGTTNGDAAVRCAYLTNGAVLSGFTLTNGATRVGGDFLYEQSAGGAFCDSASAVISNCVITGNSAYSYGGGAQSGTLKNCVVTGNSAFYYGGGASGSTLNDCTVCGNSAYNSGGGINGGAVYNSVVYYNGAPAGANFIPGTTMNYCCSTPLPGGGVGNISAEPQLASISHLSINSPCRGAGNPAYAQGTDIDGEPWLSPPSIGSDEYQPGSVTGPLSAAFTLSYSNVAAGFTVDFVAAINGRTSGSSWDFGDGVIVSNRPYCSHSWTVPGDYSVVLIAFNESLPAGVMTTSTVHVVTQPVHFVALGNTSPAAPYTSWVSAATNIQDAVDATSVGGALILVSNGVYQVGGRIVYGALTNRLVVTKAVTLQSVNGPGATSIVGQQVAGTTNGSGAVRCVYLGNETLLSGFTLTNGATLSQGDGIQEQAGGGVWCQSASAVLSNCVVAGNSANAYGGGAESGTLNNCVLSRNSSPSGGGAFAGILNYCLVISNSATIGAGTYAATLNNCSVIGNSATSQGGGVFVGTMNNTISYYNTAPTGTNFAPSLLVNNCCTIPLPATGSANFTNAPLFVNLAAGDFHLQATSPCINSGLNSFAQFGKDFDGNPRISGYTVDVGAYEFQSPASIVSYAWMEGLNLPVDGSADFIDTDGDGMNNWQEWRTGTDPKNSKSFLHMLGATNSPSGNTVTWQSTFNWNYFLERATNIGQPSAFQLIQSNINGSSTGKTSFTDTNAPGPGPYFYRVGVP
jgi:hypothetical protein